MKRDTIPSLKLTDHDGLFSYIDRIPSFDQKNLTITTTDDAIQLEINNPYNMYSGYISLQFTSGSDGKGQAPKNWQKKPSIILSGIQSSISENRTKNPIESIQILYTLLATIQQVSKGIGNITHLVRANNNSQPFFEKLVNMGIYYFSDEAGIKINTRREWLVSYILYATQYPNIRCEKLVHKFEIPKFTEKTIQFYQNNIKKWQL